MLFHNEAGQVMNLADNLTIKELLEMGVELTLSEKIDPKHELWLAGDMKEKPTRETRRDADVH